MHRFIVQIPSRLFFKCQAGYIILVCITVFLRKQPALEFNPHSNVIRNFWEKKKMKSALECNPQRFCEFWFLIWITTWPTVMEVASCKNRQNTKENAKIWQFLLKATKLVSLNWKMTPNYSVYFGLMGKRLPFLKK